VGEVVMTVGIIEEGAKIAIGIAVENWTNKKGANLKNKWYLIEITWIKKLEMHKRYNKRDQ